ncbi:hypothetical protein AB834_07150 [PVC group bacterium (ex Bugula neritina AB1)]|nr:hypothetical protein AB834_07150 [PVC group bacterium (ex Bugula neritina AB1)]
MKKQFKEFKNGCILGFKEFGLFFLASLGLLFINTLADLLEEDQLIHPEILWWPRTLALYLFWRFAGFCYRNIKLP